MNHVEQAFAPLASSTMPFLSRRLTSTRKLMPLVGYGTACYRGREREGEMTIKEAVRTAVRTGCRLIDCSLEYGGLPEVGKALQDMWAAGEVRREQLFITSSLTANLSTATDLRADVQQTLNHLGTNHLDALLFPYPKNAPSDGLLSK